MNSYQVTIEPVDDHYYIVTSGPTGKDVDFSTNRTPLPDRKVFKNQEELLTYLHNQCLPIITRL